MNPITNLYYGILNDYSIQRFTLSASDVLNAIPKKYITGKNDGIQFQQKLVTEALQSGLLSKKLTTLVENFARELNMNLQTLREKY